MKAVEKMTDIEALVYVACTAFVAPATASAVPTKHYSYPPYHVETLPIGSCVCREDGFNCLSFEEPHSGAKFTTLARAQEICAEWNEKGVTA